MTDAPLPAEVLDALRRGNSIEAIKLLRASTGLGLKEAKDVIDAHQQGNPVPASTVATSGVLPPAVIEAVRQGNKIEAIKRLREHSGLGLKEAKDVVDAFEQRTRVDADQGSPGQVRSSRNGVWWAVALVLVILIVLFMARG